MAYTIVPASGRGAAIVNLEKTPAVRATAGQGGASILYVNEGYALAPSNMPTTDFLPIVRIPTSAIVKKVEIACDAAPSTSLTGSVGVTFSDVLDGTSSPNLSTYALTGATPSIVSQSCFLFASAITTYLEFTDITFANATGNSVTDGFYVPSASGQPLWQALTVGGAGGTGKATSGATPGAFTSCVSDPGGFFDVCWFETTTGVNTSAVYINLRVTYAIAAT
jgi:hypothetical protein